MRNTTSLQNGAARAAAALTLAIGAGALGVFAATASFGRATQDAVLVGAQPGVTVLPRLIYMGNPSCTGSACHSADAPKLQSGQMIGDEFHIWSDKDPHAKAFRTLSNNESKQIAGRLGINDAATSGKCLTCHAMPVPEGQRGERFSLQNAVGCEACHGPSQKYLEPHAQPGWCAKERAALGHDGMMATWGVLDTTRVSTRAAMCTACHLQIDKDMLDAGHPPLKFEMFGYDNYVFDDSFKRHWDNPTGALFDARLWAVGQAVALNAAKAQAASWKAKGWDTADADALVRIYEVGVAVAKKHFGSDTPESLDKAAIDAPKAAAAAKDLASTAGNARTALHREILAYGVGALVAACYDAKRRELDDDFYDAFFEALDEAEDGGDGFAKALTALANAAP